jgi:PAS domain S-box-containing protein
MYVVLLKVVQRVFEQGSAGHEWVIAFLATLVAVLLAPPVKDFVQTTLDRAFYRDRYDYRRALVGFARDLNSDLDLGRLSARLVSRVVETLEVDCMALMVESESGPDWVAMHAYGFPSAPPVLPKLSGIGRRLAGGHPVALDDPTAVGWFAAEEIEFWRDASLYYFVPCISQTGATAVLALGRKHSNEPLSSEDMALLAAVAAQMATALENARLYRQLHVKAIELDRLRAFNENILESLDNGLLVVDLHDKVVRWNTALETLYGVSRSAAAGRAIDDLFDGPCVEAIRAARRDSPTGRVLSRVPLHCRGAKVGRTLIVNCAVGAAQNRRDRRRRPRGHRRHPRGRDLTRAVRRAAADFREDGLDRPARRRRGARGQHAAHGHLELHADAARRRRPRGPEDTACSRRSSVKPSGRPRSSTGS